MEIKHRCNCCKQKRKTFYCQNCIKDGAFHHSTLKPAERFADMKIKLLTLNQEKEKYIKRFEEIFARRNRLSKLEHELLECRQRIEYLKLAHAATEKKIENQKKEIDSFSRMIKKLQVQQQSYPGQLRVVQNLLEQCHNHCRQAQEELTVVYKNISHRAQHHIHHLVDDLFPIKKLERQTSGSGESQTFFTIVNEVSILPANGDYVNFDCPVSDEGQPFILGTNMEVKSKYCLAAALAYLTQLVRIIAFFLNVRLPKPVCFSEFCHPNWGTDPAAAAHCIAKLNANVVHLCHSQLVPVENPVHTVVNIISLINSPNLGRLGPFEVKDEMMEPLERHLLSSEGTRSAEELGEEEEEVDNGWETISHYTDFSPQSVEPPKPEVPKQNLLSSAMTSILNVFGQN